MSRKYTTKDEVYNYLLQEVKPEQIEVFEPQIDRWIVQITKYVETITQRIFETEDSDFFEERVYDGKGKTTLLVDEFTELEKVLIKWSEDDEGEEVTVKSYPANTIPKFQIFKVEGFPTGNQNIIVSAKWGFSDEVPDDISFATMLLVAGVIQNGIDGSGENQIVKSEKIDEYTITYADNKKADYIRMNDILKYYRKITI